MKTIGVTGGVGCGKSLVLEYLENRYGAVILRMDDASKSLMEPGGPCYEGVRDLFGEEYVLPDGTFDRAKIAETTFHDPALLEKLNAIVHPATWQMVIDRIREEEKRGTKIFFAESALIANEKGKEFFDELWYIYASEPVRRQRLKRDRGYTDEKTDSIMANQVPEEVFRQYCGVVIDNSGLFEDTERQIDRLMGE